MPRFHERVRGRSESFGSAGEIDQLEPQNGSASYKYGSRSNTSRLLAPAPAYKKLPQNVARLSTNNNASSSKSKPQTASFSGGAHLVKLSTNPIDSVPLDNYPTSQISIASDQLSLQLPSHPPATNVPVSNLNVTQSGIKPPLNIGAPIQTIPFNTFFQPSFYMNEGPPSVVDQFPDNVFDIFGPSVAPLDSSMDNQVSSIIPTTTSHSIHWQNDNQYHRNVQPPSFPPVESNALTPSVGPVVGTRFSNDISSLPNHAHPAQNQPPHLDPEVMLKGWDNSFSVPHNIPRKQAPSSSLTLEKPGTTTTSDLVSSYGMATGTPSLYGTTQPSVHAKPQSVVNGHASHDTGISAPLTTSQIPVLLPAPPTNPNSRNARLNRLNQTSSTYTPSTTFASGSHAPISHSKSGGSSFTPNILLKPTNLTSLSGNSTPNIISSERSSDAKSVGSGPASSSSIVPLTPYSLASTSAITSLSETLYSRSAAVGYQIPPIVSSNSATSNSTIDTLEALFGHPPSPVPVHRVISDQITPKNSFRSNFERPDHPPIGSPLAAGLAISASPGRLESVESEVGGEGVVEAYSSPAGAVKPVTSAIWRPFESLGALRKKLQNEWVAASRVLNNSIRLGRLLFHDPSSVLGPRTEWLRLLGLMPEPLAPARLRVRVQQQDLTQLAGLVLCQRLPFFSTSFALQGLERARAEGFVLRAWHDHAAEHVFSPAKGTPVKNAHADSKLLPPRQSLTTLIERIPQLDHPLDAPLEPVWTLKFSPDGTMCAAAGGTDGGAIVRIYRVLPWAEVLGLHSLGTASAAAVFAALGAQRSSTISSTTPLKSDTAENMSPAVLDPKKNKKSLGMLAQLLRGSGSKPLQRSVGAQVTSGPVATRRRRRNLGKRIVPRHLNDSHVRSGSSSTTSSRGTQESRTQSLPRGLRLVGSIHSAVGSGINKVRSVRSPSRSIASGASYALSHSHSHAIGRSTLPRSNSHNTSNNASSSGSGSFPAHDSNLKADLNHTEENHVRTDTMYSYHPNPYLSQLCERLARELGTQPQVLAQTLNSLIMRPGTSGTAFDVLNIDLARSTSVHSIPGVIPSSTSSASVAGARSVSESVNNLGELELGGNGSDSHSSHSFPNGISGGVNSGMATNDAREEMNVGPAPLLPHYLEPILISPSSPYDPHFTQSLPVLDPFPLAEIPGHIAHIVDLEWSRSGAAGSVGSANVLNSESSGTLLATASADGVCRIISTGSRTTVQVLPHPTAVTGVCLSPIDSSVAVTVSLDRRVRKWDLITGRVVLWSSIASSSTPGESTGVPASASTTGGHTVGNGAYNSSYSGSGSTGSLGPPSTAAYTPDGLSLLVGTFSGHLIVLQPHTLAIVHVTSVASAKLTGLEFSAQGSHVLVTSADARVRLVDLLTLSVVATMQGHSHSASHLRASMDGDLRVIAGGEDGQVSVWRLRGGLSTPALAPAIHTRVPCLSNSHGLEQFVADDGTQPNLQHVGISAPSTLPSLRSPQGGELPSLRDSSSYQSDKRSGKDTEAMVPVARFVPPAALAICRPRNKAHLWCRRPVEYQEFLSAENSLREFMEKPDSVVADAASAAVQPSKKPEHSFADSISQDPVSLTNSADSSAAVHASDVALDIAEPSASPVSGSAATIPPISTESTTAKSKDLDGSGKEEGNTKGEQLQRRIEEDAVLTTLDGCPVHQTSSPFMTTELSRLCEVELKSSSNGEVRARASSVVVMQQRGDRALLDLAVVSNAVRFTQSAIPLLPPQSISNIIPVSSSTETTLLGLPESVSALDNGLSSQLSQHSQQSQSTQSQPSQNLSASFIHANESKTQSTAALSENNSNISEYADASPSGIHTGSSEPAVTAESTENTLAGTPYESRKVSSVHSGVPANVDAERRSSFDVDEEPQFSAAAEKSDSIVVSVEAAVLVNDVGADSVSVSAASPALLTVSSTSSSELHRKDSDETVVDVDVKKSGEMDSVENSGAVAVRVYRAPDVPASARSEGPATTSEHPLVASHTSTQGVLESNGNSPKGTVDAHARSHEPISTRSRGSSPSATDSNYPRQHMRKNSRQSIGSAGFSHSVYADSVHSYSSVGSITKIPFPTPHEKDEDPAENEHDLETLVTQEWLPDPTFNLDAALQNHSIIITADDLGIIRLYENCLPLKRV